MATYKTNDALMRRDRAKIKAGAPKLGKQKLVRVKKGQRPPSRPTRTVKTS